MGKYTYNKDFFEKIDNEKKAYWLGFLYADGCINRLHKNGKPKGMTLEITLCEKDKVHLEKLRDDLESNVPIKEKPVKLNGQVYNSNRLVICCTKMCNDLIDKGCTPQKSLTLKFPTSSQVPNELTPHFIRGYFDGDGCINMRKESNTLRMVFIGTKDFLNETKRVLTSYGCLRSEPKIGTKGNAFQITIHGLDNIKDIYDYLYKDCNVYLDRKHKDFNDYLNLLLQNRQNKDSNKRGVYLDRNSNRWITTINLNGKRVRLGSFKSVDEAIRIRKEAEINKMKIAD